MSTLMKILYVDTFLVFRSTSKVVTLNIKTQVFFCRHSTLSHPPAPFYQLFLQSFTPKKLRFFRKEVIRSWWNLNNCNISQNSCDLNEGLCMQCFNLIVLNYVFVMFQVLFIWCLSYQIYVTKYVNWIEKRNVLRWHLPWPFVDNFFGFKIFQKKFLSKFFFSFCKPSSSPFWGLVILI